MTERAGVDRGQAKPGHVPPGTPPAGAETATPAAYLVIVLMPVPAQRPSRRHAKWVLRRLRSPRGLRR